VFNHFPRKEDLLAALITERRVAAQQVLTAIADRHEDAAPTFRAMFAELGAWYDSDPIVNRAFVRSILRAGGPLQPGWYDTSKLFAQVLRDGQTRGAVRRSVDPDVAGLALLDAYFGALFRWSDDGTGRASLRADLEEVLEHLLTGLLA